MCSNGCHPIQLSETISFTFSCWEMIHFEFLLHQVQLFDLVRHVVIYKVHVQKPHNSLTLPPLAKKKKCKRRACIALSKFAVWYSATLSLVHVALRAKGWTHLLESPSWSLHPKSYVSIFMAFLQSFSPLLSGGYPYDGLFFQTYYVAFENDL